MKKLILVIVSLVIFGSWSGETIKQQFITTDIDNYWIAYEKIISTKDSALQYKYLREFYLDKATEGLKRIIQVKNYSEKNFIDGINNYPKFWKSIKPNTLKAGEHFAEIEKDIQKLKQLYPDLKPSPVYFFIGAFRSGGMISENNVLISCELSLADKSTITDELPEWRQPFYKEYNPIEGLSLLCTHEYVHTQQKELVQNLLSMCMYEGVAEFISCKATGEKSDCPAIEFGKANAEIVLQQFVSDLYIMSNDYNWLYGQNRNDLKVRDLGYYIGYEICERYYNLSADKSKAIKELIELDYTNEKEVERIIDKTNFLPKKLEELNSDYEKQRPTVTGIAQFKNGSKKIKPGLTRITVTFSKPLNKNNTGIDFGPLGENFCPQIKQQENGWSEDGKSWTFEADLKPNQRYQILISNNFRMEDGVRLKPYLIDITTTK